MRLLAQSIVAVFVSLITSSVSAANPLEYRFGDATPVYEISVDSEWGSKRQIYDGYLSLHVGKPTATGQVPVRYWTINRNVELQLGQDPPQDRELLRPQDATEFASRKEYAVYDKFGTLVNAYGIDENGDQLPSMLGFTWSYVILPLPKDGAATWKQEEDTIYFTREKVQDNRRGPWGGGGPWGRQQQQEKRTNFTARRTETYTRRDIDAKTVAIDIASDLSSGDKVNDKPRLQLIGKGSAIFDTTLGMVRSIDMTYSLEVNESNLTAKFPVKVKITLLDPAEAKKRRTAADEEATKRRNEVEQARSKRDADERTRMKADSRNQPDGAERTNMVGGSGGGPFAEGLAEPTLVIGFDIKMGNWGGRQQINKIKPIYTRPEDDGSDSTTQTIAAPGYVVGGIIVNGEQYAQGARIIFIRRTPTGVDPKDNYLSPWIGQEYKDRPTTTLAGKGELVIGVYGRQGLNTDGLGLIVFPAGTPLPKSATAPDSPAKYVASAAKPTGTSTGGKQPLIDEETGADIEPQAAETNTIERIESQWVKRPAGKTFDVLASLKGDVARAADGQITIPNDTSIETRGSYRTPATFRIILKSSDKEIRLGWIGDVVLNPILRPEEVKVENLDGNQGTAENNAALPTDKWVGIEIIGTEKDFTVYVDGKRRYVGRGDFSGKSKPFSIVGRRGNTITLHSVTLVR